QPSASIAQFRASWFWTIAFFLLVLVCAVVVLLATTDPDTRAAVSGLGQSFVCFIALGCSIWVSMRTPSRRARWAWRSIAFSQLLYLLANGLTIAFPPAPDSPSVDYLTVALFLAFYFFLALGMLVLPVSPISAPQQARLLLDV